MVQGVKERFGVKVRPLDRSRFADEVRMFLDIYNSSLGGTWGFVPLTEGEVKHMAASLKHLIEPELALVAEVDGKPVGTVFCLLDYNPRIKAIDGRLFPFGFLRSSGTSRAIKRLRAISTNVVARIPGLGHRAGAHGGPRPPAPSPGAWRRWSSPGCSTATISPSARSSAAVRS